MTTPTKYEDVVAQLEAALGREAALREELDNHDCATLLINAWVDAHGKQIPWDKAIEIIAVATKMPDAEKTRLLCLDDQYELLQQRLTVAERRSGELECFSVKQAAILYELGIQLDEVDDLFGETLKNARRYEYLRSVMAIENLPDPHPEWSEPSEVESKRIDDICDAALKPAADGEGS